MARKMHRYRSFLTRAAGLIAVLVLFSLTPAHAEFQAPEEFVQNLGDQAVALMEKDENTFAEREAEFRKLLLERFDMRTIGRFVLGRHVQAFTEEELDAYDKLFVDFIVRVYTARLDNYEGVTFEVTKAVDDAGGDVIVRSQIIQPSGQAPVRADWRVRTAENSYKIVDVYVEGISMLATQRSEFASVIERRGLDGFMDDLRTRANGPSLNTAAR